MSEPRVSIRATRDTDLIKQIDQECFPNDVLLKRHLKGGIWWIAWLGKTPVGHCCVFLNEHNEWWAVRAAVLPIGRDRGIQRKLLRVRENYVRRQGATEIFTYVQNENIASLRNVIRSGYVPYRACPAFLWMGKTL